MEARLPFRSACLVRAGIHSDMAPGTLERSQWLFSPTFGRREVPSLKYLSLLLLSLLVYATTLLLISACAQALISFTVQLPSHPVPIAVRGALLEEPWALTCTKPIGLIQRFGESIGNFQQLEGVRVIELLDWDIHMQMPRPRLRMCVISLETQRSHMTCP